AGPAQLLRSFPYVLPRLGDVTGGGSRLGVHRRAERDGQTGEQDSGSDVHRIPPRSLYAHSSLLLPIHTPIPPVTPAGFPLIRVSEEITYPAAVGGGVGGAGDAVGVGWGEGVGTGSCVGVGVGVGRVGRMVGRWVGRVGRSVGRWVGRVGVDVGQGVLGVRVIGGP